MLFDGLDGSEGTEESTEGQLNARSQELVTNQQPGTRRLCILAFSFWPDYFSHFMSTLSNLFLLLPLHGPLHGH